MRYETLGRSRFRGKEKITYFFFFLAMIHLRWLGIFLISSSAKGDNNIIVLLRLFGGWSEMRPGKCRVLHLSVTGHQWLCLSLLVSSSPRCLVRPIQSTWWPSSANWQVYCPLLKIRYLGGPTASVGIWLPLCSDNADCAPFDCPKDVAFSSFPSLHGIIHLCPQVKALLHEGHESPHRRSLIPPVTFEVSGCALVLCFGSWGTLSSLWNEDFGLTCTRSGSPATEISGQWSHLWRCFSIRMGVHMNLWSLIRKEPLGPRWLKLCPSQQG